jgi:hypothetical protein
MKSQSKVLKSFRSTEITNIKRREINGNVRIYSNKEIAVSALQTGKPVSGIRSQDDYGLLYYVNGSNRGDIAFLKLVQVQENLIIHHGLKYWSWNYDDHGSK